MRRSRKQSTQQGQTKGGAGSVGERQHARAADAGGWLPSAQRACAQRVGMQLSPRRARPGRARAQLLHCSETLPGVGGCRDYVEARGWPASARHQIRTRTNLRPTIGRRLRSSCHAWGALVPRRGPADVAVGRGMPRRQARLISPAPRLVPASLDVRQRTRPSRKQNPAPRRPRPPPRDGGTR